MRPVIIVGTDFSETSLHAAREARRLGGALGGVVEVIHVREGLRRDPFVPDDAQRAWLESAEIPVDDLCVRWGTAWVELVRLAQERDAALIVTGTHGLTGFQPMALGSTAERLAVLAPRPVVLVGPREVAKTSPDNHTHGSWK